MNDPLSQFTLREWWQHMRAPATLGMLLGIGAILGLAGPFETGKELTLLPRLAYWIAVAGPSYGLGYYVHEQMRRLLGQTPLWQQVLTAGLATGVLVSGLVIAANYVLFQFLPSGSALPGFVGSVIGISILVTGLIQYAQSRPAPTNTSDLPETPALLGRLPLDKRGALVALSSEDHYVRVQTVLGEEMVLIRLSDAIGEVGNTPGLQVHRSHWVALDQIRAVDRKGDRATLMMTTGAEIPVSRSNLPKIKEAGLLPRNL